MDVDGNTEIKDFTIVVKPKRFRVGDDMFQAPGVIGLTTMEELAKVGTGFTQLNPKEMVERVKAVFDLVLEDDSAARFRQRMESKTEALDVKQQVLPILLWLLEEYGLRPTQPSTPSSTGPDGDGTSSTPGAPPTESTPSTPTTQPGESST